MKTRILTIILSLLLIVPIITTTSFAEKVSGTCGENLTWEYDTETKTLTVSGEGDMEDFFLVLYENSGGYGNFAGWKDYRGEIEKLVVEEGVTSIGDNSFSNCVKLTEVSLPQTLTRIGRNAFNDCALLESIDLPDGLTEIGLSAFGNCTSLKEITIPGGVEELPMSAFGGCASLETLNISEGVKSFGRTAFGRCTSLKSVDFPESFEEIGMEAFGWCTALETVNLPDKAVTVHPTAFTETPLYDNMGEGINYIGKVAFRYIEGEPESNIAVPEGTRAIADYCFSECGNIKSVTVPSSVEYLGPYAFDKCPALESINVDDGNENYVSVDGIAYTKDMKTLVRFPQGRKANSLDLPDSIEILGASCLKDSAIKFVRIGDGLQLIKADATAGCDYVLLYCDCRYPAYTLKGDKFKVEINTEPTIIKYDDQGNVTSKTYTQQIMYYYSDIPTVGEDDWDRYGDLIVRTLWNY
ncbi:MAG: leucine-rich repeat domain-containing protein, partial [Clostridia bacterium]|nr:leucine-rich repeat domain-containing protein [Clostridia bacterium]